MKLRNKAMLGVLVLVFLCALPQIVVAGPPLICHAIDIGQAKSLPWSSNGWNLSGQETYDISRLVDNTMALLTPTTPVLVRIETLRRATLYTQKDPMVAKQLFMRLRLRALTADGKSQEDALAQFDYGYLVETFKEARWIPGRQNSESGNLSALVASVDGYSMIVKAIKLRRGDPQMEFAAALITLGGSNYPGHQEHLQKALDGASADPLLAKNLSTHFIGQKTETIAEMFKKRQAEK
ncbi:MAG TPA: hypothetical protein VG028_10900 [Terriglobia bacterium]|nr:hypothetical protein [Terriglobia bacterium]